MYKFKSTRFFLSLLLTLLLTLPILAQNPDGFPEPDLVVLPGTFQSELGCSGDWQPACENTALIYDASTDLWLGEFDIPAGDYEYKVALNGSWAQNYGAGAVADGPNIPLAVAEDSTVTFSYDHNTGIVTDSINGAVDVDIPEATPEPPPVSEDGFQAAYIPDIYVRGTINNWDNIAGYDMVLVADNTYSLVLNLSAGTYQFKIAASSWSMVDLGGAAEGQVLAADENIQLAPKGPNINLQIDSAGSYEFLLDATDADHPTLSLQRAIIEDSGDAAERDLYLRGKMNEWGVDDSYLFTRDDDMATLTVTLAPGLYAFKIADTNWTPNTTFGLDSGSELVTPSSHLVTGDASRDTLLVLNAAQTLTFTLDTSGLRPLLTIDGEIGSNRRRAPGPNPDFNNLRIYQIMVESFLDGDPDVGYGVGYGNSHHAGDIRGIIEALPYIQDLGMNAIWLTPIFDSEAGTGNDDRLDATGYFTRDYFNIDPNFGTMDDARELVDTAHDLGMYVFFDGVFGHHKGDPAASPNGLLPTGRDNPVSYPGSLEFYKEVATYWIEELGIDGWRLDQAYQVPLDAWVEIRAAVEEASAARAVAGEEWGTLGYMVAEIWRDSRQEIVQQGYGPFDMPALPSAFDFPTRYALVRVLAGDESGLSGQPASTLDTALLNNLLYPPQATPNLMIGNHDLVRFGDLLQRAGIANPEDAEYWQRHKAAFSFLAAYTGPITIYYGEEIGDEVEGFAQHVSVCVSRGLCDDHVARSDGQITDFTPDEADLHDYVADLMHLRAEHPALWNGNATNLVANSTIFADYKWADDDALVYMLNTGEDSRRVALSQEDVGGDRLVDLLDGTVIEPIRGVYVVNIDGLTGLFLGVETD